jgi:ribosome-associated protein
VAAQRTSIPRPPRGRSEKASRSGSKDESRRIALLAAQAGLEKKASAVEIIDVSGKVDYADFLVLMTGASDRNVAAIAHEVDASLGKQGIASLSIEGLPVAHWVLIDFVDVVVHVFMRDVRSLYDLDGLWMDAQRVPVPEAPKSPKPTS